MVYIYTRQHGLHTQKSNHPQINAPKRDDDDDDAPPRPAAASAVVAFVKNRCSAARQSLQNRLSANWSSTSSAAGEGTCWPCACPSRSRSSRGRWPPPPWADADGAIGGGGGGGKGCCCWCSSWCRCQCRCRSRCARRPGSLLLSTGVGGGSIDKGVLPPPGDDGDDDDGGRRRRDGDCWVWTWNVGMDVGLDWWGGCAGWVSGAHAPPWSSECVEGC